jgi:mitogen-activated protein kinase kinase kinase 17/18
MGLDAGEMTMSGRRLTRLRTLGLGASGAVVSLFAAGEEELLAVKSASSAAASAAQQLRREAAIMASLRSPHVLRCLGFRATGGQHQLLFEFAPGGSLADVVAAVHLIGYTDAVPEALEWLSAEAKDFLAKCLCRDAAERWTAARLLEHPFLVCGGVKAEGVAMAKWVSPKSTLDAALWESDADDDLPETPADRIRSLAGPCSALPEWESDEGWIEVCSSRSGLSDSAAACQEVKFPTYGDMSDAAAVATSSEQACCGEVLDLPVATPAAETTHTGSVWGDGRVAEVEAAERFGADLDAADDDPVGAAGAYARRQQQDILEDFITVNYPIVLGLNVSDEGIANARFPGPFVSAARPLPLFVL